MIILIPINIQSFRFNSSYNLLRFLVLQKFSIFTFGLSVQVKSHVELIFLNKILHDISQSNKDLTFLQKILNLFIFSTVVKLFLL